MAGAAAGSGVRGSRGSAGDSKTGGGSSTTGTSAGKRAPGSAGARPFISYVGLHLDDEENDPEGLDQSARMALEDKAIALILQHEPQLQRTATHNPGFDLYAAGGDGQPARWIEVKAMTGGLQDRPVGLSHTQFSCAGERGDSYWLYVVEHAGSNSARIVRIQDPAGKARTFTLDHGWLSVAEISQSDDSETKQLGSD